MSCSGSPFPVGGHDRLAESFHLLVSGHVRREVYAHNLVHVDTASRIPWKERAAGASRQKMLERLNLAERPIK